MVINSLSPYWGNHFFQFFVTLIGRIIHPVHKFYADELQLCVLILLAVPTSLLGIFISLRKMSMLANSLSHTILLGIVLAYLFSHQILATATLTPTLLLGASLISAIVTALITEGCVKLFRLQNDASIGLVFTFLFSLGIILVALFTKNTHLGTEVIMGNIDALHKKDLYLAGEIFIINLLFILFCFKKLYITTFDQTHSYLQGISPKIYHYLLIFFLAGTSIAAFRAVGVILFLSFLVGPFLIARTFTAHIKTIMLGSSLIAIGASLIGVAFSRHLLSVYHMPCSTSGLVVVIIALLYMGALVVQKIKKRAFYAS